MENAQQNKRSLWGKFILSLIAIPLFYNILLMAFDGVSSAVRDFFPSWPRLPFVLASVALLHLVIAPWMRLIYQLPYGSLIGKTVSYKHQFMLSQLFLIALFLLSEPVFWLFNWSAISFIWQDQWGRWFIWFLPLLILIALQTSAEEFLFRGFLQGELSVLVSAKWVSIVIPAILWALIHQAMFDEVVFKVAVVLQMFVIGLILGDWRARTGSAIGPIFVHFLLNAFTMLIYGISLRPTDFTIVEMDMSGLSQNVQLGYFALVSLASCLSYGLWVRRKLGN